MELFEAARRFGERFPNSGAGRFIAQITEENILGDVITAKGQRPDVVEILTVHSAKGRQWEIVAIAGLQEGQWPNLRQRGSLLGSERLVERMRHGALPRKELDLLTANGLAEDERRLLHVAVTRAKSRLIVSAVEKDEEEPSIFFEEIYHHLHPELDEELRITAPVRPITPAALVATLRSELQGSQSAKAAAILQRLKVEGLAQADPEQWSGSLPISSTAPVIPVGALVPISPSSAENFTDCGVKWFLEKSGGGNGDTSAQILGSAIHAFAALMGKDPNLSEADLVGRLTSAWKLIDPHTGWVSAGELRRAVRMLQQFMEYHTTTPRELLGVEIAFSITLGRAVIKGSVDRLEVSADGELFIVDFKTSATPISLSKALENKQMQAYQLAVAEGGFTDIHPSTESSGAALVYLGATSKKVTQRLQPVIDSASVKEDIVAIGEAMSGNSFIATINSRCKQCLVKNSCPIQSDGRAVME